MKQCRLCLEEEENKSFVKPCICKGSLEFIHRRCMQNEINSTANNRCSICKTSYGYFQTKERESRQMKFVALLSLINCVVYYNIPFPASMLVSYMISFVYLIIAACLVIWSR
jgi:E3 ubiquitin-protein ligase DOA10